MKNINDRIRNMENIFRINFRARKTEKALVFTDGYTEGLRKIARNIAETGRKFVRDITFAEYRPTGTHGVEPPEEIWAAAYGTQVHDLLAGKGLFAPLLTKRVTHAETDEIEQIIRTHSNDAADIVIALSHFSTTHTRFRDMLNRIRGARYASMPLFDEDMLTGPMGVDWEEMFEKTERIARVVNSCDCVEIRTPNGTSVSLAKKEREARMDTGIITERGEYSNLPAGEVYFAPVEGSAEGQLVLEWAPTRRLKSPVTLRIERGMVREVEGSGEYADQLKDKLSEAEENRNVAELGIGTNDRASRPDNILESEKISGTVHIALGDNSSFGGTVSTPFHQDFVFFQPTVTLISAVGDRTVLLEDGKISAGL